MFRSGCAEQILDVPLFAELYGYGMFQGRRNRGVHDPLYCRAFSFNDGKRRAMIIYTDTCVTDDLYAREMRALIASKLAIAPDGIAFVATHTHSAPPLGSFCGVGFGECHPEYQIIWKQAVLKVARAAVTDEEEIALLETGKAPVSRKFGKNRIEVEKNAVDGTIRWVRFLRKDGSCKILLHNHGVHGIAMNSPFHKLASADWMGAANRMILERGLADMPLFLLGPCGDVNTYTSCTQLKNDTAADVIAKQYVDDLERNISTQRVRIEDMDIAAALKTVHPPYMKQTPEELLRDAAEFRKDNAGLADRLEEMAIMACRGENLEFCHDLQVIRFGALSFFFIPGEYFVESGADLLAKSVSEHSFAATVANGNGGYFPSEEDMKRYPDPASRKTCTNSCAFGFYEIYGYPVRLRYKYRNDVAAFIAQELLSLEKSL